MIGHKPKQYAIIGAGPAGLACAKVFLDLGIPFQGFEASKDIGGLWNFNNPNSPLYPNVHLISSRKKTEFKHFPMQGVPEDYPHHSKVFQYLKNYAKHFNLMRFFKLDSPIKWLQRLDKGYWELETSQGYKNRYKGIIIATGIHNKPKHPKIPGYFSGQMIHSSSVKSFDAFKHKKVLIIGAGNSGCDLACDLSRQHQKVGLSMRGGNYVIPKYILGQPADRTAIGIRLPARLQQFAHEKFLNILTGQPQHFGLPIPDCRLYEKHPIINSELKYQIGHGHIQVYSEATHFNVKQVLFKDGVQANFDAIILATGFAVNYPFLAMQHLNWNSGGPQLYLNIFNPKRKNLFVMGLLSSLGLGWESRYQQALIIGKYLIAKKNHPPLALAFEKRMNYPLDLSGGYHYKVSNGAHYYVHNRTYMKHLKQAIRLLS